MDALDQLYQKRFDLINALENVNYTIEEARLTRMAELELFTKESSVIVVDRATNHGVIASQPNRKGERVIHVWHTKKGEKGVRLHSNFIGGDYALRSWFIDQYR